jgi:hypothetical protein
MSRQDLYNRIHVGLELEGASNVSLTQMAKLMQPVATAFHEDLKVRELDETDAISAGPHEMGLYWDPASHLFLFRIQHFLLEYTDCPPCPYSANKPTSFKSLISHVLRLLQAFHRQASNRR